MGDKPPYEDNGVTHGICDECDAKWRAVKADRSDASYTKSKEWRCRKSPTGAHYWLITCGSNMTVIAKCKHCHRQKVLEVGSAQRGLYHSHLHTRDLRDCYQKICKGHSEVKGQECPELPNCDKLEEIRRLDPEKYDIQGFIGDICWLCDRKTAYLTRKGGENEHFPETGGEATEASVNDLQEAKERTALYPPSRPFTLPHRCPKSYEIGTWI